MFLKQVIREFGKVVMFIVMWALPMTMIRMGYSQWYMLLLALSFIGTLFLFAHYEKLSDGEK